MTNKRNPHLSLIVLRAANLNQSLAFYRALGLEFVEEQHGKGPVHYSCQLEQTVVELYPGSPGTAPDRKSAGATLIGFQVEALPELVETLKGNGIVILTEPQDSAWGRRAVVQDLDGRAIELTEQTQG